MTGEALRASWIHQMNDKEMEYNNLYSTVDIIANNATPQTALNWSLKHLFERSAVVRDTDLLSSALRSARGGNFSVDALKSEFEQNPYILRELGGRRVTTQDALETEQYILRSVKDGQGQYQPLASGLLSSAEKLNPLQLQAAASLLSSRDLVTIFRGGAGTGKSFTLRHIVDALAAAGKQVVILAPQNQQVVDLTRDGFKNGQTVSTFLGSPLQLDPNSVMIVDEAGQIGGQDMATLIAKAKVAGARLILSGDTRQHGAVAASDALQAIERYANPHCAELVGEKAIQRQQEAVYRQAVASAERGDTEAAWDLLDKQGAIKETTIAARTADAAALYVEKMATGSVLMLSQTNVEVEQLNSAIREKLITAGKLDPASEISNTTLRAVDLTNAEKEQARSYFENSIVQLNRKLGNVAAGSQARFLRENGNGGVILSVAGQVLNVSQKDLSKLTICEEKNLKLCRGDKIQLKANCTLSRNSKLANGQILTVRGVDETGGLLVTDAYEQKFTLPSDFRQFQLGYAVSSYSAQGKTVDHVIISDSQCKAATSQKEFYVSISRGRKSCSILTSDRETLQDHIQRLGTRDLASDLTLDPSRQAAHGWHGDARMVVSPSMLRGFLGHAGARKMPWGIDLETGEKVDLFGNSVGLLAVRGLAKLVQVILRCVAGMFRAKEVERAAENSR